MLDQPTAQKSRIEIRPATPADISLVYSTWLRAYKYDSPITRYLSDDLFFKEHQALLDKLLANNSTTVVVACDGQDPDLIFGWLAYSHNVVHFVYVKKAFRHAGIARQLISSQDLRLDECEATHLTYALFRLWKAGSKIAYNPYKIRGEE